MKSIYLSILSLSLVSVATAQTSNETQVGKIQSPVIKSSVKPTTIASEKAVLWGPNSMGVPAEWSFTDNTSSGDNWVIGSAAPTGGLSAAMGAITSTTANDGFALFDSDALGDTSSVQNSDVYFTTPIDLTGQMAVAVEFESYYRAYQGNCYVIASTDGVTWTEVQVHSTNAVNSSTANPEITTANISGIVGGSATAYIGFRYIGGSDYAWMVDDISIVTLPDNNVALTTGWHADIFTGLEYSMTLLEQVREMIPVVIVENQGGSTQTVDVTCDVSDGGSIVATMTQSVTSVPNVIDTLWFNTGFTPATYGDYTPIFSIPADMVTTNDTLTVSTLQVNDDFMAHDYGTTGTFGWDPATDTANAQAPHGWGNIYYPEVDVQIGGVDVNFATGTSADLYVLVRIWELNASGSIQDPLVWNNEIDHIIIQSEIGSTITTIVFPSCSLLEAGKGYIIDVLKVDGTGQQEALYIGGTDASQEDDDYSTVGYGDYGAAGTTFYSSWGFSPYVRANLDYSNCSGSVNENTLKGVSVYPNPSQGEITITNKKGDANSIEITNLAGQIIYTTSVSSATTVDLGPFGSGVYIVKISNKTGSLVERIVIK